MQRRRSTRPTSVTVLLAAFAGAALSACAGSKFETDDNNAASTAGTTTASSTSSEASSDPGNPPPVNLPAVEPPATLEPPRPPDETSEPSATGDETETVPGNTQGQDTGEQDTGGEDTAAVDTGAEDTEASAAPTTAETSGGEDTTPPSEGGDVPDTEHCAPVADWDPAWAAWEQEVLVLVNEYRAEGANCDTEGEFGPAEPLTMEPMLRCSARLHSKDMFEREFFDHTNPDGLDPFDRMAEAGFEGSYMGENIAYGQPSPEEVMVDWMESDGHCSNIMNPNFTIIGVGYHEGAANPRDGKHFWTQNFGTPFAQGGGFGGNFGR